MNMQEKFEKCILWPLKIAARLISDISCKKTDL